MAKKAPRLSDVVGSQTYTGWVEMLRQLVPDGRTHRLAPLIAGMLQYATLIALEQSAEPKEEFEEELEEASVTHTLAQAAEVFDVEEAGQLLGDLLGRLFKDAGVPYRRTSARGEEYSLAEAALYEYVHWYDMLWEA